jgi:hypothetical protein
MIQPGLPAANRTEPRRTVAQTSGLPYRRSVTCGGRRASRVDGAHRATRSTWMCTTVN